MKVALLNSVENIVEKGEFANDASEGVCMWERINSLFSNVED